MAVVDDFVNPQLVFEDRASQFYRAWCVERSCKVILKVCRNERPDASETEMYRREFAFHSRMDHHGLMKALALQQTSMGLTLILEDRGGDILKRICEHLAPSHENLLRWFLEISRILAYCHSRGQFHGHLTPYCILIDTVTDRVQLAGFEYGLELITSPGLNDVELLLMTLAYSAPELRQVGDARKPDAKSDLYAMGAIMYEAFSGRLPFDVDTASDLLHSHAAVAPLPPSRYNPDIPSWLDEIIMTLLAKVPARRVSSAERLAELISEGMGTGRLLSTGVGEGQGFSEELCCREEDKAILSDWLREMDGRGRVPSIWPKGFLLTGDEGVGKTSLARWGLRHVAQHHPRVLSVTLKFDQDFRSHEDVFVQVVGQVVEMILGEPEEVLVSWRTTLNEVMKGSAAHLAAIVPEFGLLSSQPPVAQQVDTDGVSVTHQMMMDRFFSLFSRMGRPLLLFVDDVQWADEDSAQFFLFLQKLALEKIGLLFTLRSGVSVEGATEILVSYLKASEGRRVHHLSHFSVDDVATFLSSRLQEETPRVAPLATLLYTRTGGNPFYLQSFWIIFVSAVIDIAVFFNE